MTLPHGTDRLESARLVLRRIEPDDLPFFARIHALPEVAQYLGPGYPRPPERSAAYTFDPAVGGRGFAAEAVRCVRDYSEPGRHAQRVTGSS